MKTYEVETNLIGKRVKGKSFGEMVTGTVTRIDVSEITATVYWQLDTPQNWGGKIYINATAWARRFDQFGSLKHLELID